MVVSMVDSYAWESKWKFSINICHYILFFLKSDDKCSNVAIVGYETSILQSYLYM
jgi:hypothetical protein